MSADNLEYIRKLEQAKNVWRERHVYLEKELAQTSNAVQRFELRKEIERCQQEIETKAKEIETLKKERQKESQQKTFDILDSLSQKMQWCKNRFFTERTLA
jgi:16S rRNA C1402 (ribose-2'-O) methylase RsmI